MSEGAASGVRQLAGRYQVGELIGRGGMADVFVGTDSRLGRRVAIKLLKPSLANDPAFRTRFRREAQDAAKMAHPSQYLPPMRLIRQPLLCINMW